MKETEKAQDLGGRKGAKKRRKKGEKKGKKGVDKGKSGWYIKQAVAPEGARTKPFQAGRERKKFLTGADGHGRLEARRKKGGACTL